MKYKIIKGNLAEIEDKVNAAIRTGYKPQGGLYGTGQIFYQAMVYGRKTARTKGGKKDAE